MLCRAFTISAAVLTATGGLLAASASAAPAPVDLTMVGSNTTQEVMGAVAAAWDGSTAASTRDAKATNVFAQPTGSGTVAPSDSHCNGGVAITYIEGSNPSSKQRTAPNGSKDGKAALATSVTNGDSCVSVARSSSPGSSTDAAGTQAYGYAVDAVSWATASNSNSPANLSMTQLEGIYDCKYTNWSQVGGRRAPIVRFFPQNGSGSGSFFAGVLGFDPRIVGGINTCSGPAIQIEENEATAIKGVNVLKDSVMVYSSGAWISQANHVDPDLRNGYVLRSINNRTNPVAKLKSGAYAPSILVVQANVEPSTYRPTSNTLAQGVRNLFNFINTNSVDYVTANNFVGATSALCTGKDAAIVAKYGFAPIAKCVEQF
jgi:ABC-type phosphate transport system substrate-binding protein